MIQTIYHLINFNMLLSGTLYPQNGFKNRFEAVTVGNYFVV